MADTTKDEKSITDQLGDALDAPLFTYSGYVENENHVPDPFFQSGNVDTSDTSGTANNSVNEISPIFEIARRQNLRTAARALDPNDPSVPAELVVLPQSTVTVSGSARTADEGREAVVNAVKAAAEKPVEVGGLSPAQQLAAEEDPTATPQGRASETDDSVKSEATPAQPAKAQAPKTQAKAADLDKTESK